MGQNLKTVCSQSRFSLPLMHCDFVAIAACLTIAALCANAASTPVASARVSGDAIAARSGSSCAHPWKADYRPGGYNGGYEGDQHAIYIAGTPRRLTWTVMPSQGIICTVRIKLADGRSVAPTKLQPSFPGATPTGGEYTAPRGPHSPLREMVVTAARSPIPRGTNCHFPLASGQAVDGGLVGDTKDLTAEVVVVSDPNPGSHDPMSLQLEIHVHNPRVVICRANINVSRLNFQRFPDGAVVHEHLVTTSGSTVTSPDVVVPSDFGFSGGALFRLR